jgi:polyferredoxin
MGRIRTISVRRKASGVFSSVPVRVRVAPEVRRVFVQAVITTRNFSFSYYMAGFFLAVGALMGRFVCGWLCPFGLVQDLLHRIPFGKKITTVRGDRFLRYLKYGILLVFVILLPMFVLDFVGQGEPWFCKWICPSGTLMAGWPLVLLNTGIRQTVGLLFAWKNLILIVLIVLSVIIYRPFCRYLCPLGAIYGLFNPISLYRYRIDTGKCTNCGDCQSACKMNICVNEKPNSPECIRCGECIATCKKNALSKVSFHRYDENGIMIPPLDVTLPFFRSFSCNGKTDSSERSESEAKTLPKGRNH